MDFLKRIPGAAWAAKHTRLAAWIVLSVGMVAIVGFEARDAGLLATQFIALLAATVLVAGLCVYIVAWEDSAEPAKSGAESSTDTPSDPAKES